MDPAFERRSSTAVEQGIGHGCTRGMYLNACTHGGIHKSATVENPFCANSNPITQCVKISNPGNELLCRAGIAGAVQRPGSASATGGASPALLLLLARLCVHLESAALPCAVEAVASAFGGAGGGLGADQPPAFVAAQVSRCARSSSGAPPHAGRCHMSSHARVHAHLATHTYPLRGTLPIAGAARRKRGGHEAAHSSGSLRWQPSWPLAPAKAVLTAVLGLQDAGWRGARVA